MPKKKKKSRASGGSLDGGGGATPGGASDEGIITSPTRSSQQQQQPKRQRPPMEYLSLRLIPSSSSGSIKSLRYSPHVVLHERDAEQLDVLAGERVILIATTQSSTSDTTTDDSPALQVVGAAIGRVQIASPSSTNTPTKKLYSPDQRRSSSSSSSNKLTPGHCHVFPVSLAHDLFRNTDYVESQPQQQRVAPSQTPPLATTPKAAAPPSTMATPTPAALSSSKSKFSFAKGGGGDLLISPPSSTNKPLQTTPSYSYATPQKMATPNSTSSSSSRWSTTTPRPASNGHQIWIIPLEEDSVDLKDSSTVASRITQLLCYTAHSLHAMDLNSSNNHQSLMDPRLVQRLFLAHTESTYLARDRTLRISMQGQSVECTVVDIQKETKNLTVSPPPHPPVSSSEDHLAVDGLAQLTISDDQESSDRVNLAEDLARMTLKEEENDADTNDNATSPMVLLEVLQAMKDEERQKLNIYKVTHKTRVTFGNDPTNSSLGTVNDQPRETTTRRPLLVGMESTLDELVSLLGTPLFRPDLFQGSLRPPRGVLLHGPPGVGKTCLAKQFAQHLQQSSSVHVLHVNCASLQALTSMVGQAERRLSQLFQSAEQHREGKCGSLIVLDDVHLICPRRGGAGTNAGSDRLSSTLLALLDGIGIPSTIASSASRTTTPVVILAVTTNPSLLDPALRRPGRLDSEVEVPLPDEPTTRSKILQFQLEALGGVDASTLSGTEWLAQARLAKGFTGADCTLAVKEALRLALRGGGGGSVGDTGQEVKDEGHPHDKDDRRIPVTREHLEQAIRSTKPSAIKSVTVEIPQVHWSSIGGMEQVKRQLREAIEFPLTHGHLFQQLHIPPPRGVLLYGPPGCSKTLMARALATEGQMNFLAVKGPELLSKWLGESERALASLFKRARLAAPSVIFFDEIDAIASKRGGSSTGGGERLLSQLLTELDGVQNTSSGIGADKKKQQRVVVVGATNRPDLLDSALMRPGRMDRLIYVGVPDEASRANIFELGLSGKSCSRDIDISRLAQDDISHGLSGAEVIAVCRNAALMALEEEDSGMSDESHAPTVCMQHMVNAIEGMERQITSDMLAFYAEYGGNMVR